MTKRTNMNLRCSIPFFLLFITISLSGCNKSHLSITFKNVFIQNYRTEEESVLFYIQAVNGTREDVFLFAKSDTAAAENPGFFLVSNEFYSGAVKLQVNGGDEEKKIKSGGAAYFLLFLDEQKIQSLLKDYTAEKYSHQTLLEFLKRGNYSLVYISHKEPGTQNVLKSDLFKTIEIHSADTIQKLLTP
ncbi:hypothetical protein [Mucilaginibacter sp.]|nr:hypothetical protein [Mucilaginibacter sp.]